MSEFDPVSYIMGAKSAGGGGGGGGGFTLLHGTYSTVDDTPTVTLPITASALYALMQTSCVAFDYTEIGPDHSTSILVHLTAVIENQPEGYADVYYFGGNEFMDSWASYWIEGTDAVVLTKEAPK